MQQGCRLQWYQLGESLADGFYLNDPRRFEIAIVECHARLIKQSMVGEKGVAIIAPSVDLSCGAAVIVAFETESAIARQVSLN